MWFVLLLLAGFILWHFIPKADPNRPAPRFRTETRAVESDPDWARFIEEHCESPAETAFLRAMIRSFCLKPVGGSLSGAGLRLDFQVEESGYRVDFLANQWLVIEVDGAAYHSSQEAVSRDKVRDQHFESLGYSVLRIPAKVVFNAPEEAVRRVQAALQAGKRPNPVQASESGWQRLSDTMSLISDGLSEINTSVARRRILDASLKDAKAAFETEKMVIEAAVESAKRELKMLVWLDGQDHLSRQKYEDSFTNFAKALNDQRGAGHGQDDDRIEAKLFPVAPLLHQNPEHDAAIKEGYAGIVAERGAFLEAKRLVVASEPRLAPLVDANLEKLGCAEFSALLRTGELSSTGKPRYQSQSPNVPPF